MERASLGASPSTQKSTVPPKTYIAKHHVKVMPKSTCRAISDPSLMQDVLMGGAIVGAVGATLVNGFAQEKVLCTSCAGNGGVRCFACEGTGKFNELPGNTSKPTSIINDNPTPKRDSLGRNVNKRECTACLGCGLLFCKTCNGSGYR